jgi:carbon-monoxide dehydrogenase medium subunit
MKLIQPKKVSEVSACLLSLPGRALVHAGGTDLLVRMRNGLATPECLIDLSLIAGLREIRQLEDDRFQIGAMASLSAIADYPAIRRRGEALREALDQIGSIQIRNRATLAGNICNASPAADCIPPLLVFDAQVNVMGANGLRQVPIDQFVTGPGQTALQTGEFVESVEIVVPRDPSGSCFMKLGRRRAVDCSIVSAAVVMDRDRQIKAAFGAVAPVPLRAKAAEKVLSGVNAVEKPYRFQR